jgi:hypothetical protein
MKELDDLEKAVSSLWMRFKSDRKMQLYAFLALTVVGIITNWEDVKTGFMDGYADAYKH